MATLKGPLLSLRARGKLGSSLVYTANRGRPVLKTTKRKTNPNTIKQASHRSMLRYLVASWTRLIPPARASWVNNVPAEEYSAYHWYIKWNMERWRRGIGPATWYGLQDTGAAPTMTTWNISDQAGIVRLQWPTSGFTNTVCATWHKGWHEDFDVSPDTAIWTDWWTNYRYRLITDRPTFPGWNYYRLMLYNAHGVEYLTNVTRAYLVW